MRQTCLDQFYQKTIRRRSADDLSKAKKIVGVKDTPRTRHKGRRYGKKNLLSVEQHRPSSIVSDCTAIYGKENNILENDFDEVQIISDFDSQTEKKFSFLPKNTSPEPETRPVKIDTSYLSTSDVHDVIPKKEVSLDDSCHITNKIKEDPESPSNSKNTVHLTKTPKHEPTTPQYKRTPPKSVGTSSSSRKSRFSPKVSSQRSPRHIITPKKLFGHTIDTDIRVQALEQLNFAKQGAIPLNNFDLEEIYSNHLYTYEYSYINTKASVKYELNNLLTANDLNAKIWYTTIFTVLSNPINCGYFDEDELDLIYSMITLPVQAQMLLARLIKRKRTWYRKGSVNYVDIAENLEDIFKQLASRHICTFDIQEEELSTLIELLQADEIRKLCQTFKLKPNGKKEDNIRRLLKFANTKPLFPGMKNPSSRLNASIFNILGYCVRITDTAWSIVDRIMTLLFPNQDPELSIADTFYVLCDVYQGKLVFPEMPPMCFPIFSNRQHLLDYILAKNTLFLSLHAIKKKDWDTVQKYGNIAVEQLSVVLKVESKQLKNSKLPTHVKHFMPGYVWLRIVSNSIDAFKKSAQTRMQAVEMLNLLIEQDCHMQSRKGRWYGELALIESYHQKNVEASAQITIRALKTQNLTQVDKVELIDKLKKIVKKKTGVQANTKACINEVLDSHVNRMMPISDPPSTVIDALNIPGNVAGKRSMWCIETGTEDQSYGSVETVAKYHYESEGFSKGLHCEGALPITLFFTLFWEELYDMQVPGAYVSAYQYAPQDLYTEGFYENRKEQIDMKLGIIDTLDRETLGNIMETKFEKYSSFQSVMQTNLFKSSSQLKEVVCCMGVEGVVGICRRLIDNFKLWKSGFPDLIVWNYNTKQCKIVEVKGPRDTLSTKQRLWLDYLIQIGLDAEVCLVKDQFSAKRSRIDIGDD